MLKSLINSSFLEKPLLLVASSLCFIQRFEQVLPCSKEKRSVQQRRRSLINDGRFLTPDAVVEPLPQHVQQRHHGHVENEEAHQAWGTEEAQEGIHPNPSGQKHPDYPAEHIQEEERSSDWLSSSLILYRLVGFICTKTPRSLNGSFSLVTKKPRINRTGPHRSPALSSAQKVIEIKNRE